MSLRHLTPREWDVLREMAEGRSNKQIALKLGIKAETVKHHASVIFQKLGVDNRVGAVATYLRSPYGR